MNPKFYVISGRKVGPRVAAAAFFAPQGGARHQPADGHEGRDAAAIVAERRVPLIQRLDRRAQQPSSRHRPTEFHINPRTSAS